MLDANLLNQQLSAWHTLNTDEFGVAAITTTSVREKKDHKVLYDRLHYFKLLSRTQSLSFEVRELLESKKITICGQSISDFLKPTPSKRTKKHPIEKLFESNFTDRLMLYPRIGIPRRPNHLEYAFLALKDHLQKNLYFAWREQDGTLQDFQRLKENFHFMVGIYGHNDESGYLSFQGHDLREIKLNPLNHQYNPVQEMHFQPFIDSNGRWITSLIFTFTNRKTNLPNILLEIFPPAKENRKSSIEMFKKDFQKGFITVIKRVDKPEGETYNGHYYECLCKCGKTIVMRSKKINWTDNPSCGCAFQEHKDLSGKVYGKLTVQNETKRKNRHWLWKAQCECGNVIWPRAHQLTGGQSTSCGTC